MTLIHKAFIPRVFGVQYDGTNGTELAANLDIPIMSDDGQTLILERSGDPFPVQAGNWVLYVDNRWVMTGRVDLVNVDSSEDFLSANYVEWLD